MARSYSFLMKFITDFLYLQSRLEEYNAYSLYKYKVYSHNILFKQNSKKCIGTFDYFNRYICMKIFFYNI